MKQASGFIFFFFLMLFSFSTTMIIIEKSKFREEQIEAFSLTHGPSIENLDHISTDNRTTNIE